MELRELSAENKAALLGPGCEEVLKDRQTAKAILARLHSLNPQLAGEFRLKETALSGFPFRLLCSPDARQDVPSYLVLSYCWRGGDWQAVDNTPAAPWPLCRPMVEEVLKRRTSHDEGVWIDVPCINQEDEDEKRLAIGSMDVVYRAARQLLVVLEDVQLDAVEQAATMKYSQILHRLAVPGLGAGIFDLLANEFDPSEAEYTAIIALFRRILSARWFSRTWCTHEIRIRPNERHSQRTLFLMFGSTGEVLCLAGRFLFIFAYLLRSEDKNEERRLKIFPHRTKLPRISMPDSADMSTESLFLRYYQLTSGGRVLQRF